MTRSIFILLVFHFLRFSTTVYTHKKEIPFNKTLCIFRCESIYANMCWFTTILWKRKMCRVQMLVSSCIRSIIHLFTLTHAHMFNAISQWLPYVSWFCNVCEKKIIVKPTSSIKCTLKTDSFFFIIIIRYLFPHEISQLYYLVSAINIRRNKFR